MLNNKGFAVSAVLYTLLIAFLIFLAVTLKELASSTNLINHANDDLTNGLPGVKVVMVDNKKLLQVTLAGKVFYCNPASDCDNKYNFSFKKTNTDYMFYINESDEPNDSEHCFLPNCVYRSILDYNNAK